MSPQATSLTSWTRALQRTLEARGIDALPLFARAGLDPGLLVDPNARYPQEGTTRLWKLAVEATGDPAIGLAAALQVSLTTFHALGFALAASSTLREAFERLVHDVRIVSDEIRPEVKRDGDCYRVVIYSASHGPGPCWEATDGVAYVLVRLCRMLHGRALSPREVRLRRPPPVDTGPYQKAFRARLSCHSDADELVYEREPFEAPLPGANPELARINEELIARHLARHDAQDVPGRVRALLIELLPQGEPTQERVAERLHMSARSLQRKLVDAGTGFRELLAETRRELAVSYLSEPQRSVSEIAYLLGCSEVSTFTRAFRRWTGQPPSRWGGHERAP